MAIFFQDEITAATPYDFVFAPNFHDKLSNLHHPPQI